MPNDDHDDHDDHDDTPMGGTPIPDTDRLPVIGDDSVPEGTAFMVGTSGDVAAVVGMAPKPPAPARASPAAMSPTDRSPSPGESGARWICSSCAATWKADPGPWHTHTTPVPGSMSRVTHDNHAITKVGG